MELFDKFRLVHSLLLFGQAQKQPGRVLLLGIPCPAVSPGAVMFALSSPYFHEIRPSFAPYPALLFLAFPVTWEVFCTMGLDCDPLWDEQGQLRRGCTVREIPA